MSRSAVRRRSGTAPGEAPIETRRDVPAPAVGGGVPGLGVAAQEPELQAGVRDHGAEPFVGGDRDVVAVGGQSPAQSGVRGDVAGRPGCKDQNPHVFYSM
ncbi:hypothetical protein PSA01_05740 [Pseudonocardia saturnea]|uniref:Uncharacterized protein n=1 Tax=Pseudonocardia saturnea TaxID=33909 RepID=A0ABQ0RS95_9PSEU|nr:hypothetical protein Pdca_60980 [Pseudonocardia autotrophica]GEC23545.1 hypothetical protein PSA01_05740 [Pseudonocardia saturnea]